MKIINIYKVCFFLLLITTLTGCPDYTKDYGPGSFRIQVTDQVGEPVNDATVIAIDYIRKGFPIGYDTPVYSTFQTDEEGFVWLHGAAINRQGRIAKTNYTPIFEVLNADQIYEITKAEIEFASIGSIDVGDSYTVINDGVIYAFDHQGNVKIFSLEGDEVINLGTFQLLPTGRVESHKFFGNSLWISVYNLDYGTVYCLNVAVSTEPVLRDRVSSENNLHVQDLSDSLLIAEEIREDSKILIFQKSILNGYTIKGEIPGSGVISAKLIADKLVFLD